MKTYKFLQLACVVALMGAATGCADDALVQSNELQESAKGQPVTIQASVAGGDSRIAYQEGDSKMTMIWESDDVLKVVNPVSEALITNFMLMDGEGESSASFQGTPDVAYGDGDVLYTLYHNGLVSTQFDGDDNIVLSLAEQDGTLNNDYQLMFGKTSYKEGVGMQTVSLNSLVSILKVTITTDKTLKKITLDSGDFRSKATLVLANKPSNALPDFQTGDLVYCYEDDNTENNGSVSVSGTFVPENGEVTVYFYILPAMRYWLNEWGVETRNVRPSFTAIDEDGVEWFSTASYQDRELMLGMMYRVRSNIFTIAAFDNEATADGSMEHPYEISTKEQFYSLMFRINRGMSVNGNSYANLHYKLTDNIVLDGSLTWQPMWFNGSLDGCGHSISGPVVTSLFSQLNGTVSNLTLDLDVTIANDFGDSDYGCLALRASNATIINCVNQTDVIAPGRRIGGMVGALEWGSKMIACGNTGDVTVMNDNAENIGNLVGSLRYGASIEGCYSTGAIIIPVANGIYIGGLVGMTNWETEENGSNLATLTGCWTSYTYELGSVTNATRRDITGYGEYKRCYKVETTPSSGDINSLNAGLAEIGSICRFDAQGMPVIETTSGGSANGGNFGDGGEF